ncbi:PREDICTED: angiopoietin-1-like [Drosophila arizonae]|uniref:Angiopoietin-1-like n=1 Tax=Drosophila arizonae TaxID=7263 RepID=A0ABM1Q160_DROAR|nr:PREDICTED: angiopoietin-1-like [Drosophila arizonae]
MKILLMFAILATSLTAIRAQCERLSDIQNCCQALQEITVVLEKQDKQLQLVWDDQSDWYPEIQALNESIENLQEQLCQQILEYDQTEIQWTLQSELSDLQDRVENLQSLLSNGLQEKYYQQCFNKPWRPIIIVDCVKPDVPPPIPDYVTGPGWLVIQNRFDGSENFYRSWAENRDGFGNRNGEFFLGLEVIHRLTNYQRHELLVLVQTDVDYEIYWARYDNFVIGSESEKYNLKSLGKFEGVVD